MGAADGQIRCPGIEGYTMTPVILKVDDLWDGVYLLHRFRWAKLASDQSLFERQAVDGLSDLL